MDTGPVLFVGRSEPDVLDRFCVIAGELADRGVSDVRLLANGQDSVMMYLDVNSWVSGCRENTQAVPRLGSGSGPAADGRNIAARSRRLSRWHHGAWTSLIRKLEEVEPQLMIIDAGMQDFIEAAMFRKIPFVLATSQPVGSLFGYPLPHSADVPSVTAPRAPRHGIRRRHRARMSRYGDAAAAVFGFSHLDLERTLPAAGRLHALGPVLMPPPRRSGELNEGLTRWLNEHESVVYVELDDARPSCQQLFALFVAFAQLARPHHVLWRLPDEQREVLPPRYAWPDHVRIERSETHSGEVLDHPNVRVLVTLGHWHSLQRGAYHGKPLLVLPWQRDSGQLATNGVHISTGLAVDGISVLSAADVLTPLSTLLTDNRFSEHAATWGKRLRQAGGARSAADLILKVLAGLPGQHASYDSYEGTARCNIRATE